MKINDFISELSAVADMNSHRFEKIRTCVPLGKDAFGEIKTAHGENVVRYHHICVSGENRTEFILRTVVVESCLYDRPETAFLILSPNPVYGKLAFLKTSDFSVPYIRDGKDFDFALDAIRSLLQTRAVAGAGYRLFIVADGLEKIVACSDPTEPYLKILEAVENTDTEVITGLDFSNSAVYSYPGAFVGIGNCLVSVKSQTKADVTGVENDSSLSLPKEIEFPSEPSVEEAVEFLNGL